ALGPLARGAGGSAAGGVDGPDRLRRMVTGEAADQITLWGFIGGEKVDLVRNQKVRDLLRRRYGIILDARRAGSVEMVSDAALISQRPQWLLPASSLLVQLA